MRMSFSIGNSQIAYERVYQKKHRNATWKLHFGRRPILQTHPLMHTGGAPPVCINGWVCKIGRAPVAFFRDIRNKRKIREEGERTYDISWTLCTSNQARLSCSVSRI